ncbi:chloromuconate cycloisomerase [Amycolatopsis acidicola]|uniref:Chloromuconate cycloisomerase n=1 Tax=Amycolatopsis acidicola TaxID=2596893 RepID=A0A5N0US29_9PSEU|nr:enolase C-terminal domain-like protein [Amycolatopsis acidicola]KAA9153477.1 chloromuconate cycloisomerase [Amycolatopsis acidicola]
MRIAEAGLAVAGLPLRRQLRHAGIDTGELTEVFLRVLLEDGHVGWAETRGNGAYATGCSTEVIVAALSTPGWHDPARLARRCPPAAMLVDIARRDAHARAAGIPLWATLSEKPAPASLPTHAAIAFGTEDQAGELADAAVRAGFGRIKIRIGGDPEVDRARVARVREIAGPPVVLAVDANGGWDTATAIEATRWLAELGVAWFEQPVKDLVSMAAVRAASPVPLWADESVRDAESVRAVAELGAADGVHLKLEKAGTVDELAAAIGTARRHGLDVGLGQMDCGRLGCATTAHLAAGLHVEVAELWGCAHLEHDVTPGLELRDGAVPLPGGPGLGLRPELEITTPMRIPS